MDRDSVLLTSVCKFEIGGKKYNWFEPTVEQGRRQRAALLRLTRKAMRAHEEAERALTKIERDAIQLEYSQDATADIMGFLCEYHKEIDDDAKDIWRRIGTGEIEDVELVTAYKAVLDFVMAPFVKQAKTKASLGNGNGSTSTEPITNLEPTNA